MPFRVPRAECVCPIAVRSLLAALTLFTVPLIVSHAGAVSMTVTMVGFEFSPRDITIAVGDTVTWVNPEGMFHTTTNGAGSEDPEAGVWFDAYFLGTPDETFSYVFADSGTFAYFCRFHESLDMKGSVTVESPQGTGVSPSPADPPRLTASPNPSRESTTLAFTLPQSMDVRADVYDLAGRRVRALFRGRLQQGEQAIRWDGRDDRSVDLPSGVYVMRLELPHSSSSVRVTLLR